MGIFWVTSFLEKSDGKIISSGHNDFDADGFFGAYVFALPTTEASFFIDDLNDIIPALNRGQDRFPHRPHRLYVDIPMVQPNGKARAPSSSSARMAQTVLSPLLPTSFGRGMPK